MEHATKSHILDDRYLLDACETVCKSCRHMKSFWDHSCAAYPGKIPLEYWNRKKKCPKMEKKVEQ